MGVVKKLKRKQGMLLKAFTLFLSFTFLTHNNKQGGLVKCQDKA